MCIWILNKSIEIQEVCNGTFVDLVYSLSLPLQLSLPPGLTHFVYPLSSAWYSPSRHP